MSRFNPLTSAVLLVTSTIMTNAIRVLDNPVPAQPTQPVESADDRKRRLKRERDARYRVTKKNGSRQLQPA